jgi:serine/alanine adding enzyme
MTLRVIRSESDPEHWDAFVRAQPHSSFAHLMGWKHVIGGVLGHEFIALAAIDGDGTYHGVLPLVRVRTPLLGHSLISVLCHNYGGPLGSHEAQVLLIDEAIAEARRSGAGAVRLRARFDVPCGLPSAGEKVLVLLDLPATPDALWAQFPSKLRSQIRRPQKEGMQFRTGADQLDAFYSVFAHNMRDLGTPVYARGFFERIAQTFDDVVIGAVYLKDVPVGAGFGLIWKGEFEITWASTIRQFNALSPNMLLYWGFMQEMIARDVGVFNFGRSSRDAGTHRFKMQWGGVEQPLPWRDWSAQPSHTEAGPSRAAELVSATWQRLPLPIANFLGPHVARRLPWW